MSKIEYKFNWYNWRNFTILLCIVGILTDAIYVAIGISLLYLIAANLLVRIENNLQEIEGKK